VRPASQVDGYLAEVDSYELGQIVFAMPKFKKLGALKVPKHNREMLVRWSQRAAAYDSGHGSSLSLTAVYDGKVVTKKSGLSLNDATTRANMLAGIEATLGFGLSGVQPDLEPYPVSPGFISLLEEIDEMFVRVGFDGRFSVTAPATTSKWSTAYLHRVSELVTQLDPLYYDSEFKTIAAYQAWLQNSLTYYSANVSAACRLVPIIPLVFRQPAARTVGGEPRNSDHRSVEYARRGQPRQRRRDLVWVGLSAQRGRRLRRQSRPRNMAVNDDRPALLPVARHGSRISLPRT
jgi:hypothetical protein